jgi:hypothetical protein
MRLPLWALQDRARVAAGGYGDADEGAQRVPHDGRSGSCRHSLSPAVVRPSWESSLPFAIAAGSRLFVERPSCDSRSACSGDEAPTPCAVTTEGRPRSRTGPQAKRLQVHS